MEISRVIQGFLILTITEWGLMREPWRKIQEEAHIMPQISMIPLCEMMPVVSLTMRRMMEIQVIAASAMGITHAIKLMQVVQPSTKVKLTPIVAEKMQGVLVLCLILVQGKGQTREAVRMSRWNLMEEAESFPPFDKYPPPNYCIIMIIIAWNCRGALKPSFQNHVRDLVQNHDPALIFIMETRIGGD